MVDRQHPWRTRLLVNSPWADAARARAGLVRCGMSEYCGFEGSRLEVLEHQRVHHVPDSAGVVVDWQGGW